MESSGRGILLRPERGQYFVLGLLVYCVMTILASGLAAVVSFGRGQTEASGYTVVALFFVFPVMLLTLRIGRFVSIDPNVGISRPSILGGRPSLIAWRDVLYYSKIVEAGKVVGVVLSTSHGTWRYTEGKTPGCIVTILGALEERGIHEQPVGSGD